MSTISLKMQNLLTLFRSLILEYYNKKDEGILYNQNLHNLIFFRDSLLNILLNADLYSEADSNLIDRFFIYLSKIIESPEQKSESFYSKNTINNILSFANIIQKNEENIQTFQTILKKYLKMSKKKDLFNFLCEYIFNIDDNIISNILLNVLCNPDFIINIEEKKIGEFCRYLNIIDSKKLTNKLHDQMYKTVVKIILGYLIIFSPKDFNNSIYLNNIKNFDFNHKLDVFLELLFPSSNDKFYGLINIYNINEKKKNIVSYISLSLFENIINDQFIEDSFKNFCIKICNVIKEAKNKNINNNNTFFSIFFNDNINHIFLNLFNQYENDNNKLKQLKQFIEDELIPTLIQYHKEPFIFKFLEYIFQYDKHFDFCFSILTKIISEIIQKKISENNILNLINLLYFFESYFSKNLNSIHNLEEFSNIIKRIFIIFQSYKYTYSSVVFYDENEHGRIISEIILDLFLLVFKIFKIKQIENIQLFNLIYINQNTSIFFEIDSLKDNSTMNVNQDLKYEILKRDSNLISQKNKFYNGISISIYFLTKYFIIIKNNPVIKNNLKDFFQDILFKDIKNLSKTKNFKNFQTQTFCEEYNIILSFFLKKENIEEMSFINLEKYFYEKLEKNEKILYFSLCISKKKNSSNNKKSSFISAKNNINHSNNFSYSFTMIFPNNSLEENEINYFSPLSNNFENLNNNNFNLSNSIIISNSKKKSFEARTKTRNRTIQEKSKIEKLKELKNQLKKEKKTSFENITEKGMIINPKNEFFYKTFSHSFIDIFFKNKAFMNLKKYYINNYKVERKTKFLDYPTRLKNFSNLYENPLFLTQDLNFLNNEYFNITHSYILPFKQKLKEKKIPFVKKEIKIQEIGFECELITIKNSLFGIFLICENYLLFKNYQIDDKKYFILSLESDRIMKEKTILIYLSEIQYIKERQFIFFEQAIEFFLKNGKTYFFNFLSRKNYNKFLIKLKEKLGSENEILLNKSLEKKNLEKHIQKWKENKLSTYDLLLIINFYSSRTYNDTSQYPIFPWVINNFKLLYSMDINKIKEILSYPKKKEELENENFFARILKYPISAQKLDKRILAIERFEEPFDDKSRSHYYSHYSTSSYIFYYLMRIKPFTGNLIKLQNNSQENANRMFVSFFETQEAINSSNDNRELIPEFYNKIELFINLNCVDFGQKSNGMQLDDVVPLSLIYKNNDTDNNNNYIQNPLSLYIEFMILHREILNSDFVNKSNDDSIFNWINNIFGKNQYIKKDDLAKQICNTFPSASYKERCSFHNKIKNIEDQKIMVNQTEREQLLEDINITINFGIMPERLEFKSNLNNNEYIKSNKDNKDYNRNIIELDEKNWIYFKIFRNEFVIVSRNGDIQIINEDNQKIRFEQQFNFDLPNKKSVSENTFQFDNNQSIRIQYFVRYYNNKLYLCRFRDNSFRIIFLKESTKEKFTEKKILCEDYVNVIREIPENSFIIGLKNGKIIEYEITNNKQIIMKKSIFSHLSCIKIIEIDSYELSLNIILTSTNSELFIRKLYDFELLTTININPKYKIKMIKLSPLKLIYIMCLGNNNKYYIFGYTLTGINFAKSEGGYYNNFIFTHNGNLIVEYLNIGKIDILSGSDLKNVLIKKEIAFINMIVKSGISYFDSRDSNDYNNSEIWHLFHKGKNRIFPQNINFDC